MKTPQIVIKIPNDLDVLLFLHLKKLFTISQLVYNINKKPKKNKSRLNSRRNMCT